MPAKHGSPDATSGRFVEQYFALVHTGVPARLLTAWCLWLIGFQPGFLPTSFVFMRFAFVATLLAIASASAHAELPPNTLSPSEEAAGWKLIFDGNDFDGWRNYQSDDVRDGWVIEDDAMVRRDKGAGDLISKDQYKWFELSLEYRISPGGNSGLMFHVTEDEKKPWQTGPEIQIQDNVAGHDPQKAGWLYQLYKPVPPGWAPVEEKQIDASRPAGQWNQIYLRIAPQSCEVCLNGVRYYNFKLGSEEWQKRVSESKFAKFDGFGKAGEGHICLQDHGDEVAFRSVKVRPIAEDGSVPRPIDGKIAVRSELAFPNLQWDSWEAFGDDGKVQALRIIELTSPNDGTNRLFAVSQSGLIWAFENRGDVSESTRVLDLTDKVKAFWDSGANEQGLLGLAFHPRFAETQTFFTYHSEPKTNASVVMRWQMSGDDKNVADPDSGVEVLRMEQPFQNHNGGSIEFGPDGHLYVATGDGGYRNDPKKNGQDLSSPLGKVLRIDVDAGDDDRPYGIPKDNPFVAVEGARPEVYAFGLRNPWRIAFDPETGDLWCADVGQELWEEVNVIVRGGNYGWSAFEGMHPFGNEEANPISPPIDPVWEYDHQQGKSITGGRVVRNERVPSLSGKYLYADYVTGTVWALTYDRATGQVLRNDQLLPDSTPVLAFGQDAEGDVYYMISDVRGRCIYRFVDATTADVAAK